MSTNTDVLSADELAQLQQAAADATARFQEAQHAAATAQAEERRAALERELEPARAEQKAAAARCEDAIADVEAALHALQAAANKARLAEQAASQAVGRVEALRAEIDTPHGQMVVMNRYSTGYSRWSAWENRHPEIVAGLRTLRGQNPQQQH